MSIDVVILNEKFFYHIFTELGINNSFNEVQLSSSLLNDDINTSHLSFESKNATKNTKLARIRSFKDDFLEKISLMRTPMNTSTLTRFVLIKIIFILFLLLLILINLTENYFLFYFIFILFCL